MGLVKSSPCILHLRGSNFVGGPEHQLLRYADSERDGAFQICLGTFVGPGEGSEFLQAAAAHGFQVLSLPSRSIGPRSAVPALVRELCLRRVDLLCTHGYKADILGLLAGWVTGIPVACFLRGWTCENVRIRFYEAIDRLALPFARRIVCLSEHQAIRLRKWPLLASRIRIVSNAINLPHFPPERIASTRELLRRQFDLPSDCLVIASGGRLSPEKGVRVFLEAAQLILGRYSNVYFLVFGEGPLREEL